MGVPAIGPIGPVNEQSYPDARIWRVGSGPKLILLHGEFGDARTYWSAVADDIASHFDLIMPDLPGFGETAPLADFRAQTYVLWLKRLGDALTEESEDRSQESEEAVPRGEGGVRPARPSPTPRVARAGTGEEPTVESGANHPVGSGVPRAAVEREPVVIAGAGFGATIARLFAAQYRPLVRRLILSGGGSLDRPSPFQNFLSQFVRRNRGPTSPDAVQSPDALFHDPRQHSTAEFQRAFDEARISAHRVRRAFVEAPLPPALTPACTTLLLWGHEDRYCPPTVQQSIAAELKDPRQVEIYDAGHLVMIEQPRRFSAHLLDFLGMKFPVMSDE